MKKLLDWCAGRGYLLIGFVFIGVFFFVLMSSFLSGDKILMSTDAAIANAKVSVSEQIREIYANWRSARLLGSPLGASVQVGTILRIFLNPIVWNNLVFSIACFAGSLVFLVYAYRNKLSLAAGLLGAIVLCWLGGNFSLIYSGHNFKPYVVLFFLLSLLVSRGAVSIAGGVLWGAALGGMFLQQADIAFLFALFSGAYLLFQLWLRYRHEWKSWIKMLVPGLCVAFLFAAGPLLGGYRNHVKGVSVVQNRDTKWDFVTQWSMPPEDCLAIIAPGYKGWRTGEQDSPYWGRLGQSPEWEKTRQGVQNFKLDDAYLGIIPVLFALYAVAACRRSKHREEILFWAGVVVVSLLLSFGKFCPLYALFFRFPVVGNIRAPVKFLQVTQIGIAILCAYGVHATFFKEKIKERGRLDYLWFVLPTVMIFFWWLGLLLGRSEDVSAFVANGWPANTANMIVENKVQAAGHALVLSVIASVTVSFFWFLKPASHQKIRMILCSLLLLIVAGDAWLFSRQFLKEMPGSFVAENAMTKFLQEKIEYQRVALLTRQGIYNNMLTYLLPFNRIPTFDFEQMPRMPEEYQNFLRAGQKDPFSMWRFSAVKYLLGPSEAASQLKAYNCEKVFSYNVLAASDNGYRIEPAVAGAHAVYELKNSRPRYMLCGKARAASDAEILADLGGDEVRYPPHSGLPQLNGPSIAGEVTVVHHSPGRALLKTEAEYPNILRFAERYTPDWKAKVDGNLTELFRVDYLCQGVFIPAGTHTVELYYAPSRLLFYMQCFALFSTMVALIVWLRTRPERHA